MVSDKELVSAAAAAMARARLSRMTPLQRSALSSMAGKASWEGLTPEERKLEMRRRALVRRKNRLKKAKILRAVK